jgi:hypothetical protein
MHLILRRPLPEKTQHYFTGRLLQYGRFSADAAG